VDVNRLDHATQAMADLARQWDRRLDAIERLAEAGHARSKRSAERFRSAGRTSNALSPTADG
jgi:hypothetical protein